MAMMTRTFWIWPLLVAVSSSAQQPCSQARLQSMANKVHAAEKDLRSFHVDEMEDAVPEQVSHKLDDLKSASAGLANAAMNCVSISATADEITTRLSKVLHGDQLTQTKKPAGSGDSGYGYDLTVHAIRPPNASSLLEIDFSFGIECGDDHMLLVYASENGAWNELMRWQAKPLEKISDAFGDLFVSAVLPGPDPGKTRPFVVVAHGKPWCTSRFSGFNIDVLTPGPKPESPEVAWHTERPYSRGDYESRLKPSGDAFELRVNAATMDPTVYERNVIYRYRIGERGQVHRVQPIAANARGFVEEWLEAPWNESESFLAPEADPSLKLVYAEYHRSDKSQDEYTSHTYGPVRACSTAGLFQVQINSTHERIVPGKPGGDSAPLQPLYFHVHETRNGYLMVSAPTEPDRACAGQDLMPAIDR
jgi:hypothetical protein